MPSTFGQLLRWLLPLPGIRYLRKDVRGRRVYVPIDSAAFSAGAVFTRESPYLEALVERVRATDSVLDIGAHQGLFAIAAAPHAAALVAFEPNTTNRHLLRGNLARNHLDGVAVLPVAVACDVRVEQFWLGGEQSSLSGGSFDPADPEGDLDLVVVVNLDALDLRPHIVKVDVEGAELDLLLGAREALAECRCIGVEVHPANLARRGQSEETLLAELVSQGFRIVEQFRSPSRPDSPDSRHHTILERG